MERATGDKRVEPSWLAASAILLTGILAAAEGARAAPTAGDALFIDAEGRVGIGTVEPGPALDVVGEVRACSGLAVGTGEAKAKVDIQDGERTGEHPAAVPGLYVTAPLEGARGIEFRRGDGSQGIGFGSDTVYATGADADQDLKLKARGNGTVKVEGGLDVGGLEVDGNLSAQNVTVTGTLKASRLQVPGLIVGTLYQVMTNNSATALYWTASGDGRCAGAVGSCGPGSDTVGVWDHYCTVYRNGGVNGYCYFFHCIAK